MTSNIKASENTTSAVEVTIVSTSAIEVTNLSTSVVEVINVSASTGILTTVQPDHVLPIFLQAIVVFIGVTILSLLIYCVRYLNKRQKKKQVLRQKSNTTLVSTIDNNSSLVRTNTVNDYEISYLPHKAQVSEIVNDGYEELKLTVRSFPIDRLQLLEKLGEGNFGTVHKANAWNIAYQPGLSIVAVKMLKNESLPIDKEAFKKEITILQSIPKQENIILFYGYFKSTGSYGLITEYLRNGNLHGYLTQSRDQFKISLKQKLKFSNDIARGMTHLAFYKFIHRDLAARNILLDDNFSCKITDFGLTRQEPEEYLSLNPHARFPTRWLAPESIEFMKFSVHSDVWSFGIVLWEIFSLGRLPYPELKSSLEVRKTIIRGEKNKQPDSCPDDIYNLMKTCWSRDINSRPSFPYCLIRFEKYLEKEDKDYTPEMIKSSYEQPIVMASLQEPYKTVCNSLSTSLQSNTTEDYLTPISANPVCSLVFGDVQSYDF